MSHYLAPLNSLLRSREVDGPTMQYLLPLFPSRLRSPSLGLRRCVNLHRQRLCVAHRHRPTHDAREVIESRQSLAHWRSIRSV